MTSEPTSPAPKLHVDSDWKSQAQAEKERLTRQEEQKVGSSGEGKSPQPGELPQADFKTLVSMLVSQALMGLGTMADKQSNRVIVDLEGAKFSIDLLDVLEQKTQGNLSEEEAKELREVLAELRSRFVYILQLVAQQAAGQSPAGAAATAAPAASFTPSPMPGGSFKM